MPRFLDDLIDALAAAPEKVAAALTGDRARRLHVAAFTGQAAAVERLLEDDDVDVDAPDAFGIPPLFYAAFAGNAEIATLLLDSGASVDARVAKKRSRRFNREISLLDRDAGQTPLHAALRSGSAKLVRLLLERGAEVNARDEHGATPLHQAAAHGTVEMARLLLAAGADATAVDDLGRTPVHRARGDDVAMLEVLVAAGVDVNARGRFARTALEEALDDGFHRTADFLRAHGAAPPAPGAES